ncbi:PREDICTED: zinc finger protein 583-like [Poecilia mexicana]|uniref:C2H2-type domain-containing protein n=1 Tax=Poecilia mexicana TaxID=48701 RepID=A0A3B3YZ22_9TELE|nr:PREDICTED: zinc finger protein 583-like [Poecilia mexicana]XP_014846138.1 PREDICTED: zinc finger protein 583-like [Poecilia mexicana]
MEMKIEQVVVGNEMKSTSAETKSDPVGDPEYYHHESLQCFHCLITFRDLKSKERHIKRNHRDEYKRQLQQNNTLFMCYKCNSSFSTTAELSQHQPTHFTEEKPFSCSLCQERFSTFTELNQHRRKDCGERRFLCVDCGARFPVPFRLRKHRIAMHPEKEAAADDVDMFQCCKCGVVFQTEDELLQHQEETADCDLEESRGKKRACEPTLSSEEVEVDKKIKQEDVAKEHSDSTSSAKCKIPCPEDDCNWMFATVEALRAHKKELHRSRPLKAPSSEYPCLTCGKSFARESTLKAHQNSHIKTEKAVEKR